MWDDKVNPWCHWPNPSWKFDIDSCADNLYPPDAAGLDDTKPVALPLYLSNHSCYYPGAVAPTPFLTASVADGPLSPSGFVTTVAPGLELPVVYPAHDKPLVLCQMENHAPITAPLLAKEMLDPVPELQGSNETNVTEVGAEDTAGIHENTDEINALLDSESDEGCEKVCELGRSAQPPAENNDALSVESVGSAADASMSAGRPAKRRRLCSGTNTDKSVVDTASSARPDHSIEQKLLGAGDCDAQSCCIGEVESDRRFALREGEEGAAVAAAEVDCCPDEDRERRRERIQETVAALRKIVPGGIAKDATAVLDEAICYLQYLKLKVKTLGAVSL